jgi:hypothetical protein
METIEEIDKQIAELELKKKELRDTVVTYEMLDRFVTKIVKDELNKKNKDESNKNLSWNSATLSGSFIDFNAPSRDDIHVKPNK